METFPNKGDKVSNKYKDFIPILVEKLGGTNNISAVTHCVSRLRLVLNDDSKISLQEIENLEHVKGVFKVNGQVHVIFGQQVTEVYDEFVNYQDIKQKISDATQVKELGTKKQNIVKRLMVHLSEIFIPLIPVLVAGGLILALRNILETKWDGNWAIVNIPFFNGLNDFLWIPACAIFWFLPVFIVWSVFKKMKGSQPIGILIGLSLLVAMPSTYDLNGVLAGEQKISFQLIADFFTKSAGPNFQFGGENGWGAFPIKVGYTSQVIPAIGVAFLGVYVERFLKAKVTPVLRQVVVPLVTILVAYTSAMLVIGPVGFVIGTTISIIIFLALTNSIAKYFVAPLFGFFYAPLVVTGMHHTLNAVMIQNAATIGGSLIFPILAISNIAQGAATLMYGIMHRKNEKAKQTSFPACISAWLGVTEPAMYGVNLRYGFPFFAACVGASIGSLLAIVSGVSAAGIGNGAWLGVLSIQANSGIEGVNTFPGTGYTWFILSAVLATTIAMVLTYVFSKIKFFKKFSTEVKIENQVQTQTNANVG